MTGAGTTSTSSSVLVKTVDAGTTGISDGCMMIDLLYELKMEN